MTVREKIVSDLSLLSDAQINQVADYLEFLKSRKVKRPKETNGDLPNDSIFNIGKNPIQTGVTDASENLDKYLY